MLVVDARERDVLTVLPSFAVSVQTLAIGDFLVTDDSGGILMAVERKTVADLVASLNDGRYVEQRSRIVAAYGDRVVYLIEHGGQNVFRDPRIAGVLTGLLFRRRIPVVWTSGVPETVDFLMHVHSAGLQGKLARVSGTASPDSRPVHICNTPRKKPTTRSEMVIAMLSAIPGVSDKTATALFERYGSLQGIVDAVVADRAALSTFVVGDRKLGKVGQRIADAIL